MSVMMSSDNRYRTELSDIELRSIAPAIFATAPDSKASNRYSFIPTIDVINGLRDNGWLPVAAKQTQAKSKTAVDTRLHMVRFRHPDIAPIHLDNDNLIYPEAVMTNSHNLSNSFKFMMGAFRVLCSNGLVAGESFGSLTVRHNSKAIDEAIQSCFQMLSGAKPMMQQIDRFRGIELNSHESNVFARSALNMKYGLHRQQLKEDEVPPLIVYGNPREADNAKLTAEREGQKVEYIPITPDQILSPRRHADVEPTLWNTFNVIQENLSKGGQRGRTMNWRRSKTHGINSIDKEIKINQNLWGMAEYLADHVGVK